MRQGLWNWLWAVVPVVAILLIVIGRRFGWDSVASAMPFIAFVYYPAGLFAKSFTRHIRPSLWSTTLSLLVGSVIALWMTWEAGWFVRILFFVAVVAPLVKLANRAYGADRLRDQKRRDAFARRLVAANKRSEGETSRFTLYLRPFISTGKLPAQALPNELDLWKDLRHFDLEAHLARSLRKHSPLIAPGRPGEVTEGPGRAELQEDEWKPVVMRLAERSTLLIFVPLAYEGTLWELCLIRDLGFYNKTLFIMPGCAYSLPNGIIARRETFGVIDEVVQVHSVPALATLDIAEEWGRAVQRAREIGIELPRYTPAGALFMLTSETGRVARIAPLALPVLSRPESYLNSIASIFGLLPLHDRYDGNVMAAFESAMASHAKTREYGLLYAVDIYLAQRDYEMCNKLLRRAAWFGGRRMRRTKEFALWLTAQAEQLRDEGEARAAVQLLMMMVPILEEVVRADRSVIDAARRALDATGKD